ncbi:glycerol-3-phosphate dehydrogenase [Pararhizobium mangrovi]|uniref:Glycerol-3-phosphate dehydrogenase n=1 Tax=Pararhizobium mangrovi TaxID=2590452 RepID=A0A506UB12_9HYPH|nr:glycerol-3-phosphate dehydrogenase [Pararhizobium mangrovi]TPW30301.1 glycerol-3-phosphate dehydrogenase [Pararhizobium mangrovi]
MVDYDIFVIGGGINGCGIARDAAGRGYRVGLAEMNDLGSGTSSWSTKLIHGGLRYLEQYEFRLVRHALKEREVLIAIAPHLVRPLRFVLPHHSGLRPAWLLRLGLFLYDHLGGRETLAKSCAVDLDGPLGAPLRNEFHKGFEYSDAKVDDTRLVVLNARDAADRGADIMVRTRVERVRPADRGWLLELRDAEDGTTRSVTARTLVNAAGPWVDLVDHEIVGRNGPDSVRLVQGSHVVTRRLFDHDRAYIFQNTDGRIVFAIPYQGEFTLLGTTDRDYSGDPGRATIAEEEVGYLLEAANAYFEKPVRREDVVWSFSGVRPLYDDGAKKAQEGTRDYTLSLTEAGGAALLNCFGGKITTYRVLAEDALARLAGPLGSNRASGRSANEGRAHGAGWTARVPLPGGDFEPAALHETIEALRRDYAFLSPGEAVRLVDLYGTRARAVLGNARSLGDLGRDFGAGLSEAEVRYLIDHEWARTLEDVLWRRTKLGLHLAGTAAEEAISNFMHAYRKGEDARTLRQESGV